MKVGVGSKNNTKVDAIREVLLDYPMFADAEVEGVAVDIEEFGHPKSIDETVAGAINRAKQAYVGNEYGFGIEGGFIAIPHTKSGCMLVEVCAIFDGSDVRLGLSYAHEWPKLAVDMIMNDGFDGSQAVKALGITQDDKIGSKKGFINHLTHGRLTRTDQNKSAVMMALIHLENPELF